MDEPLAVEVKVDRKDEPRAGRSPLVFVSHDTRDADVAEAFCKLLSSVSTGMLKSFRSSDRRGNQGIEYGVEWYPEIMKRLGSASDVVCLLTPSSINRPWILYEAGVAKGKLDVLVHGIALGMPLSAATVGPFAQFQNSDDSEKSLVQLVTQLLGRINNSEPDPEVIQAQVQSFKKKIEPLLVIDNGTPLETDIEQPSDAVARMFEEVKVMYQELPLRIARRVDPERSPELRRRRQFRLGALFDLSENLTRSKNAPVGMLVVLGQFRDELPWLYELGMEAYRNWSKSPSKSREDMRNIIEYMELLRLHGMGDEASPSNKRRRDEMEECLRYLRYYTDRYITRRSDSNNQLEQE
jgi:hypothetical protein